MNKSSIKIIVLFIIILFSTNFVNSTELIGIVIDDYDNLVVGANLDFKCDKNFNDINFPNITNNFGAFELENIPYGKCRVFASLENKVGFIDININKDEMYQEEIKLNLKTTNSKTNQSNLLFIISIIILIIFILTIFKFSKTKLNKKKNEKNNNRKNKDIIITQRMQDIVSTLNDVEKTIIDFLITEGGSATQSKIRQFTQIPKTSLFRWINSLENKNLVKTESLGKMKKVELSDFFLKF